MGLMRRRRPVARLAGAAAVGGMAYHAGKRRSEQDMYNEQAAAAYDATQQAPQYAPQPQYSPQPQYVPPPPAPAAATDVDELSRLAKLHEAGVLTDAEFSAAKAKVLNL